MARSRGGSNRKKRMISQRRGGAAPTKQFASGPSDDRVIDPKYDDGADDGHNKAPDVETRNAGADELSGDKPAHDRPDDAEHDIHQESGAGLVDDLAGDESGNETKNNPRDHAHCENLPCRPEGWTLRDGRGKRKPLVLAIISSKCGARLWSTDRPFALDWVQETTMASFDDAMKNSVPGGNLATPIAVA